MVNDGIAIFSSLDSVPKEEWNRLAPTDHPFFDYEFLHALEKSQSVGEGSSWEPHYLTLRKKGELFGAVPFYKKWDSYGEFIFDWAWGQGAQRAGIPYYPKTVVAVPFTPAVGERFLLPPGESSEEILLSLSEALLEEVQKENQSSLHLLYLTEAEHDLLVAEGFLSRFSYQFIWENRGYQTFEDFLQDLTHKRRNQTQKEREKVKELNLEIRCLEGESLLPEHFEAMWRLISHTFATKAGEPPYLTHDFFDLLCRNFRDRTLMVLAREGGEWVAGSLNFKKGDHLFGRYWGSLKEFPNLHFECCYYRLIDYAIERGLKAVEAGAQGEHKFFRGYAPQKIYSVHWIAHPGLRRAIDEFLKKERAWVEETLRAYRAVSPLKYLRDREIPSLSQKEF